MPLEFPCPKCQHLLRTADDKAGLSASCPACGESIWVPYPHELGAAQNEQLTSENNVESSSDRYELGDPFADESSGEPQVAAVDESFAVDTPPTEQHEDGLRAEAPGADQVAVDGGAVRRICEHCGTENDPETQTCRGCAAELPPREQPVHHDNWQPRDPDVGEIMHSSWGIYSSEMGLLIGGWLLWGVMTIAALLCSAVPVGILMALFGAADGDLVWVGLVLGLLLSLPLLLLGLAILNIGFVHFCFNVARGTSAGIGDLFYGFGDGRALIPGAMVVALVTLVANLFSCGLANIVIWPLWYAIVFRRSTAGAGLEIIQREFVTVLVIGLIVAGISIAVNMLPYVGIIVMIFAMPFLETLHAVAYLRMERVRIASDRGD